MYKTLQQLGYEDMTVEDDLIIQEVNVLDSVTALNDLTTNMSTTGKRFIGNIAIGSICFYTASIPPFLSLTRGGITYVGSDIERLLIYWDTYLGGGYVPGKRTRLCAGDNLIVIDMNDVSGANLTTISGDVYIRHGLSMEGAVINGIKMYFTFIEPTADRSVTFPNANISVNLGTNISGTTLSSGVINSSLTSVGTLSSLKVSGDCLVGSSGSINASAILQVDSTTKGFLPPRMTTTQRNAISSPSAGLCLYDTTLNALCVYTSSWRQVQHS